VFYDLDRATFFTLFLAMRKRIVYFNRNLKLKYHSFTNTFLQLDRDRQLLLSIRRQQLGDEAYRVICRLRPAVEGTIGQFKRKTRDGKLRIRLINRIRNSAILMAIGINFGRLWRYYRKNQSILAILLAKSIMLLKYLVLKRLQKLKMLKFVPSHPVIIRKLVFS
jgi:hypothetical protein